jgi:hypothetical protein
MLFFAIGSAIGQSRIHFQMKPKKFACREPSLFFWEPYGPTSYTSDLINLEWHDYHLYIQPVQHPDLFGS